jgi:DUF2905 family protein
MEDLYGIIKLIGLLLIIAGLVSISMFMYGNIPILGGLPGDFLFLLPNGELFVPLTSSIIVGLIITATAYLIVSTSKK